MPEPPTPEVPPTIEGWDAVPPPPPEVSELVAAAHRYVTRAVGVAPALEQETLPLVEHWVLEARAAVQERPALAPLIAGAAGAWFGEVLRREVDAFWWLPTPDPHDWRLCARRVFLAMNPLGAAWDLLIGSQEHPGPDSRLYVAPADRAAVEARLASATGYSEQELLRFGTRLEALQIAVAELTGAEDHGAEFAYELDDYEDARELLALPPAR